MDLPDPPQPSPPRPRRPTIKEVPDKDEPFLFSQPPMPPAADNAPDEDDDDEGDEASTGTPIDVNEETLNDIYANVSFYSSLCAGVASLFESAVFAFDAAHGKSRTGKTPIAYHPRSLLG
ncbi:hypothetical protein HYDPIDRAFT_33126 [Hydnomerulius pinastri MD-312]|uniref:Uncharacterized protein n=1 Tax=Hydnomerulius pinastri MD-312 TaxID=994086 RepID=A0A0C9W0X3_9AGAM|nr:hypothetical protein HYDPIDRAFT_33126 [Hydnomerulius pinastri MD-312]